MSPNLMAALRALELEDRTEDMEAYRIAAEQTATILRAFNVPGGVMVEIVENVLAVGRIVGERQTVLENFLKSLMVVDAFGARYSAETNLDNRREMGIEVL